MLGGLRYRQFHYSFLLGWLSTGIAGGLLLSRYGEFMVGAWWLVPALALVIGGLRSRRVAAIIALMAAGLLIGGERGTSFIGQLTPYREYTQRQIMIRGVIVADPQETARGDWRLDIGRIVIDDRVLPGEIYVTATVPGLKRGDQVTVQGRAREGFGSFQLTMYHAEVVSVMRTDDMVREAREGFAGAVRRTVREPEASLGLGFVVGQRSSLPPELDEQLRIVGLTHIVVASGYNLTILVRFARRLLAGISRYLATATSATLMICFAVFSGFSPSMNRAVVVTGLSLAAWHYGRRFHPLLLIAYVAAGTAYWNPVYIWHDIGWYLSFLAFAGILIVAPALARLLFRDRQPSSIMQVFVETSAAQVMTLPLILLVFGQLPNLALVANMAVAPVVPAAMAMTALAGIITMMIPMPAGIIGWPAQIMIGYVVAVTDWLASVPGAQSELAVPFMGMLAAYLTLMGVIGLVWWRLNVDVRARSIVE